MSIRIAAPALAAALAIFAFAGPASAKDEVMSQCSTEYQAAKTANKLGGKKWNDFLKECRARHAAAPAPAPATAPAAKANPLKPAATTAAKPAPAAAAPAPTGKAVFPTKIDPKYAKEKPGEQRMKTCLDQYNANKAKNANGGLKWIEKGGGYYSECNKRLKG